MTETPEEHEAEAPAQDQAPEPAEAQGSAPEQDAASLRSGFAAAAAGNPNQTRDHLARQESAQRQLFGGGSMRDVVMGDKNTNHFYAAADRTRLVHTRLSAEALDEALAFVPPRDYGRLQRSCEGRALAVVTGEPGSGRMAAAVHLLCSSTGRQSIYVLHSGTDFATLAAHPLPNGAGIVLPDITAPAAAGLDDFRLRQLADRLVAAGQKLIITAPDSVRWGASAMAAHHVPLGPRPAAAEVIRVHFLRRFPAAAQAAARQLLARPEVEQLIAAHTGDDRPLRTVALLATLLADAAGEPREMAQAAATGMALAEAGEIGRWFEELAAQDPLDQYFALALAVLNGLANEKVALAAKRLERLTAPETAAARDRERRPRFSSGNAARLRRVHAIQVPDESTDDPSERAGTVVRYINRDMPRRLLTHVWEQYDEERDIIAGWLRELGAVALEGIRVGAGVAAGALAMASYDHVVQTTVRRWAASRDPNQQDTAAVALQTLGLDPRFRDRVDTLLDEWSQPDTDIPLQATAARAYGGQLGVARQEASIRALARLAEVDAWPVTRAVALSLTELIAADYGEATARVLRLLGEWVSGRKQLLRTVGRLVFLYAAADLVTRRAAGEAVETWPLLLLMDQDPYYTAMVRYLWSNALNSSDLYLTAREVLSAWAGAVEGDPVGRHALARLLAGIADTDRTKAIVRRLARDWAGRDGDGSAPLSAAALATI